MWARAVRFRCATANTTQRAGTSQVNRHRVSGEVRPTDPTTFALTALLLAAVAPRAALIPALRATRVDPAVALRAE